MGIDEALAIAAQAVEFNPVSPPTSRLDAIDRVRGFFEVVDLTCFRTWAIPESSTAPTITFPLQQTRTGLELPITLQRNPAGKWHVVIPPEREVLEHRKALLAMYCAKVPTAQSHNLLMEITKIAQANKLSLGNWMEQPSTDTLNKN